MDRLRRVLEADTRIAYAVDIVVLDEAGPGVAYRVFRDGRPLFARDRQGVAERRARAVLEYLDWKPIEAAFTRWRPPSSGICWSSAASSDARRARADRLGYG